MCFISVHCESPNFEVFCKKRIAILSPLPTFPGTSITNPPTAFLTKHIRCLPRGGQGWDAGCTLAVDGSAQVTAACGAQEPCLEARARRERLRADGRGSRRAPTPLGSHAGALGPQPSTSDPGKTQAPPRRRAPISSQAPGLPAPPSATPQAQGLTVPSASCACSLRTRVQHPVSTRSEHPAVACAGLTRSRCVGAQLVLTAEHHAAAGPLLPVDLADEKVA